jgi:hypothetical protein
MQERVVSRFAAHDVVVRAAVHLVRAPTGADRVLADASVDRVVAAAGPDEVVAVTGADGVVPAPADDQVVAAEAHDDVVDPRQPNQEVGVVVADDRRELAVAELELGQGGDPWELMGPMGSGPSWAKAAPAGTIAVTASTARCRPVSY